MDKRLKQMGTRGIYGVEKLNKKFQGAKVVATPVIK